MSRNNAELLARLESLEARLRNLEDIEAIKKLTRMYGYYLDKALWQHVLPLFTDDCEVEISALGVYAGREQVEVLFRDVLGKGPAMSDENGLVHVHLGELPRDADDGLVWHQPRAFEEVPVGWAQLVLRQTSGSATRR